MKLVMHRTPSTPEPTDEAELVTAVQHGDASAFTPLVDQHLDAIHAFVSVKLPVAHLADEITHDAFAFACRNLERFTPGTSFRAWLRAIAANKCDSGGERAMRELKLGVTMSKQLDARI
jgi:DNA-directed RNA polymerase specialized sigma24 family protein